MRRLRYIALILLVTGAVICDGQTVRFQFYRTKACTVIEKLDTNYSLSPIIRGFPDTGYTPRDGTVYLPQPGGYRLYCYGPLIDTAFDIRDTGLYVFRFKEPDHGLYDTGALDSPPYYSRCDSLLNGYQEYHYANGGLEMRGVFKKGRPQDSIVTFYTNGKIRARTLNYNKYTIITAFDSLGNKLRFYKGGRAIISYNQYREKTFYPNGKLKKTESSIKHLYKLKAYYPSGSLKLILTRRYRTEYYSNGLKSISYTWNYKTLHIGHYKDFTITRRQYDTAGHITRITIYGSWADYLPQPDLKIEDSVWITDEKYVNGQKVFSVEDMDMKEYKQKYSDIGQEEVEDNY